MDGPRFEATVAELRATGSLKWSLHPQAIGAFVAEMDFGIAAPVAAAMHETIDAGLLGYLPDRMVAELAESFCGFAADRYGWQVPTVWVRPLGDVVAGLQASIEHFSAPGAPVIVPTPAYMPFLYVPPALGRRVIEVPMRLQDGRHVHDLEALQAAFDEGANLLVLCNPHNPVGRVLGREEQLAVAEVVERNGGRVFSDEIHAPLVYDGHQHVPYASLDATTAAHTITAVSASKAWDLPGTKCAQLVLSNDADAQTWSRVGQMLEHGASTIGVAASVAAYRHGVPWLDEVVMHLDGSRALLGDLLAEHLPEVGYRPPEGTYLAWLDLRALGLGDHPAEVLLESAEVALTDGPACGRAGAGFARYTFATPRPVMEETVRRLADATRCSGPAT